MSMCFVRGPAPKRSVKEFAVEVPCVSRLSSELPNPCIWISRIIQFGSPLPQRRIRLLPRSKLSSSAVLTGSPAKSLPTKTVMLFTCSCLRRRSAARCFPTKYRAASFSGMNSNARGHSFAGLNAFHSLLNPTSLGPNTKVSWHADR